VKNQFLLSTSIYRRIFYYAVIIFIFDHSVYAQQVAKGDDHLFRVTQGLRSPIRIAIDNQGIIYVTDAFQKCIIKYDTAGNFLEKITPGGLPISLAISNDNQVIFSDNKNGSILRLNSNGSTNKIYSGCVYPSSAVFDKDNNLYVVDSKLKQVIVMDLSGNVIKTIGKDILVYPTEIAYDSRNLRILIAEHGGTKSKTDQGLIAKILVFDLQGNLLSSFGEFGYEDGQFSRIQGLFIDKWGRIYIVDTYQGNVSVFNENGDFITKLSQFGKEPGSLNAPMDIVIDSKERIWVTSMNNGSIEVYSTKNIDLDNPGNVVPTESDLLQNYPNPFNVGTWIPFVLSNDEEVMLKIYDINGNTICAINAGFLIKGNYLEYGRALYWDGTAENGKPAANGIYFYELNLSNIKKVRRMIFLK